MKQSAQICFLLCFLLTTPAPATESPADPGLTLTMEAALSAAEALNVDLAAFDLGVDAVRSRVRQAGRRPNPELAVEWENLAGTGEFSGTGGSEATVAVSQVLELGGKRGHRGDLARTSWRVAEGEREIQRLELRHRVREAFLNVWLTQERRDLSEEQTRLAESLVQEMARRRLAGAASPVDAGRAKVALAAARIDRDRASGDFETAAVELAILWGRIRPDFTAVTGPYLDPPDPALLPAPRINAGTNPAVLRWRREEALRRADLQLARALGKPDLTLAVGLRRDNGTGDRALVLGAGIPLALFDRNQDEIRAVTREVEQADRMVDAALLELRSAVALAAARREAAYAEIRILRSEILPEAEGTCRAMDDGHRRGRFSLTDVLETRRTLFDLHHVLLEAVGRYHAADAAILHLTGEWNPSDQPEERP